MAEPSGNSEAAVTLERRLAKAEELGEQMLQELYGLHDQPGIRTELKMLRQDHEEQRREFAKHNNDLREDIERLTSTITDIMRKQTPRWVVLLFMTVLTVCAIIIAFATATSIVRTG